MYVHPIFPLHLIFSPCTVHLLHSSFSSSYYCLNVTKLTGDVTQRICTAAEIKFYFNSFFERKSSNAQFLRPNKNCNLTSWAPGCEPGWASSVAPGVKVNLKDSKDVPARTYDSQPCCEGFFCPQGITCMIRKCTSSASITDVCC